MYISSAPLTASTNTTRPTNETTYLPNRPQVRGRTLSRSDLIGSSRGRAGSSSDEGNGRKTSPVGGTLRRLKTKARITGDDSSGRIAPDRARCQDPSRQNCDLD